MPERKRGVSLVENEEKAQQGARANAGTCHESCFRTPRAKPRRGSSLTFGKMPLSDPYFTSTMMLAGTTLLWIATLYSIRIAVLGHWSFILFALPGLGLGAVLTLGRVQIAYGTNYLALFFIVAPALLSAFSSVMYIFFRGSRSSHRTP